jgi:hypothetical protein
MKTKIILFSLALAFTSCSKDPEVGPQGPAGPAGTSYSLSQGGHIEGTITGTRSDGTPFTTDFNYQHYLQVDNYDYDAFNGYHFTLTRFPGPTQLSNAGADIEFRNFILSIYKDLDNNQVFVFNCSAGSTDIVFTNYSYDTSTRIAQGDFAINTSSTSTGWPATIIGSFKSIACKEFLLRRD